MPNIFFTADTHFGHGRIIEYTNRPFANFEEQDEQIVQRFNEILRPGDLLYHLGDVAWSTFDIKRQFLSRLKTKEVFLILGNHDRPNRMGGLGFRWVDEIRRISLTGQSVTLCHYAMRTWNNKGHGAFQLYGHSHSKLPGLGRQMDVGVDTNNFYPWAWEEIRGRLNNLPFYPQEEIDGVVPIND